MAGSVAPLTGGIFRLGAFVAFSLVVTPDRTRYPLRVTRYSPLLRHHPRTQAKISGATMVASDSITNFGDSSDNLPQVIFSFGTAPEYDP